MDGYQFHASSQHNVLEKDITIRKAIAAHSGYKVWTLTWQDLDYFENYMHGEKHAADSLAKMYAYNFSDNYMRKLLPNLTAHAFKINFALSLSNVFRLLDRFIYPLITPFLRSYYTYLSSWTEKVLTPSFNPEDIGQLVAGTLDQDDYIKNNQIRDFNGLVPVEKQISLILLIGKSGLTRVRKKFFITLY